MDVRVGDKLAEAARYVVGCVLFTASMGLVLYMLAVGRSCFWPLPFAVQLLLLVALLAGLAVLEGLQIAIIELLKLPEESYRDTHARAYGVARLFHRGGNLERFLMGRQILVLIVYFLLARMTTLETTTGVIPPLFEDIFLFTGLMGACLTFVLGQLTGRIIATQYPATFANAMGMRFVTQGCLVVEAIGISYACWPIAFVIGKLFRLKSYDHVHGTTEEACTAEDVNNDEDPTKTLACHVEKTALFFDNVSPAERDQLISALRKASKEEGGKDAAHVYGTPKAIMKVLKEENVPIPSFLYPPDDARHVPPHISATLLQAENERLKELASKNGIYIEGNTPALSPKHGS